MAKKTRYFNFPIQLLAGFLKKPDDVLKDILDYALYSYTLNDKIQGESHHIQMAAAIAYYDVPLSDPQKSYKNGEMLYIKHGQGNPIAGLNRSIFLNFYGRGKSKFDYVCLLGFLALKSILGSKIYCKTENEYFWSRMDGKAQQVSKEELSSEIQQYANHYQTRKIKNVLKLDWHLKTYSNHTRGFYISFSLTLEKLIEVAEERRDAYRLKKYQNEERNAIREVREKLKINSNTNA